MKKEKVNIALAIVVTGLVVYGLSLYAYRAMTVQEYKTVIEVIQAGDEDALEMWLIKYPEAVKSFPTSPNLTQKMSALHWAAVSSKAGIGITELLISKGADVNALALNNVTPLHSAASNGRDQICEVLLANKAKVNMIANIGNLKETILRATPLHLAAKYNYDKTVQLLVKNGASPNAITYNSSDSSSESEFTALDYAERNKNESMVKYLSSHGGKRAAELPYDFKSQPVLTGSDNKNLETHSRSLVGQWRSFSLQTNWILDLWPACEQIEINIWKLNSKDDIDPDTWYRQDAEYGMSIYQYIPHKGKSVLPDSTPGWAEKNSDGTLAFKFGPMGSHVHFNVTIENGIMYLKSKYTFYAALRLVEASRNVNPKNNRSNE